MHEEGTLTKAAAREAIAPSAISKRLADLELVLGVTLFERSAKGMVLTPSGETLLHHARRMLVSAEQIAVEMAEHARGARGFIRMLSNLSGIVQFLNSAITGSPVLIAAGNRDYCSPQMSGSAGHRGNVD